MKIFLSPSLGGPYHTTTVTVLDQTETKRLGGIKKLFRVETVWAEQKRKGTTASEEAEFPEKFLNLVFEHLLSNHFPKMNSETSFIGVELFPQDDDDDDEQHYTKKDLEDTHFVTISSTTFLRKRRLLMPKPVLNNYPIWLPMTPVAKFNVNELIKAIDLVAQSKKFFNLNNPFDLMISIASEPKKKKTK